MEKPKDRLVLAFEQLRFSKKISSKGDFAKKMNYNNSHFSELLTGRKPITENFGLLLQKQFGISAMWLLTGEGEMLITNNSEKQNIDGRENYLSQLNNNSVSSLLTNKNDQTMSINEELVRHLMSESAEKTAIIKLLATKIPDLEHEAFPNRKAK